MITKMVRSPRLNSVEQSLLLDNDKVVLETFWQEITLQGTPLIEPISGDEKHVLVTFLWRDPGDTRNVVLIAPMQGWRDPGANQMTRLLDTDIWYKTYRMRTDIRFTYQLSPNDPLTHLRYSGNDVRRHLIPDPLNHSRFYREVREGKVGETDGVASICELVDAPKHGWVDHQETIPHGKVTQHLFRSKILQNERKIWVYTPPFYDVSYEVPNLLFVFDGWQYVTTIPTPTILDNLLYAGRLANTIAICIDSLSFAQRAQELPCYQPFVDFLAQELIPWVYTHYNVTHDPLHTVVAGSSYGGLAAAFTGLKASHIFGNVLAQSGSFWWPLHAETGTSEEWLIQQFRESEHLPLRFYIEVGEQEKRDIVDMLLSARRLRDTLRLKGYEVHYAEFNGGHDYLCWRESFANGLLALLST